MHTIREADSDDRVNWHCSDYSSSMEGVVILNMLFMFFHAMVHTIAVVSLDTGKEASAKKNAHRALYKYTRPT